MSKYQTKIIKKYESEGYGVIKLSKTNCNGIADLLVSKPNERPCLVEVKEKKDTVKPLQIVQNVRLAELMGFDFLILQDGIGMVDYCNEIDTNLF